MRITYPTIKVLIAVVFLTGATLRVVAEPSLSVKLLAEKKVTELPQGELYWTIEKFAVAPSADAPNSTSLLAEAEGSWWRFTLGAKGVLDGSKFAEIGPVSRVEAKEFLLRINLASGKPGSVTPIHSHPGSEAFYVLSGEQRIRSTKGEFVLQTGQSQPGFGANLPMQVSSNGVSDLRALVMFVVDAKQPFSSPACFPTPTP